MLYSHKMDSQRARYFSLMASTEPRLGIRTDIELLVWDNYGIAQITDDQRYTNDEIRLRCHQDSVSKEELGPSLPIMESGAGCHAFATRLIGPPTEILQAIHHDNPKYSRLYQ